MTASMRLKCSLVFLRAEAVMCFKEKVNVLDTLCSGMSDGAVDHEFNVNEPSL